MTTVDQNEINAAVWSACDTFRGTVDPSIYKDYVLTMLFLKYVSDVWQDHYDEYKTQYGDHPDLIEEMLKNERFVLPPRANFYALHEQRHSPGNGERIDKALHAIEDANIGKLRDVFQDISFNSTKLGDEQQKNDILRHLLEDFAKPELNLRPSRVGALDIIGNAYEFLIKNFASTSGKKAGEFYTPPEVSTLMAQLMDPQEGEEISDPTCGSGSLLLKVGRLIRERTGSRKYALYGQEAIGSTWALAKMNMFLHGEDNHRIEWGDTIRNPKLLDGEAAWDPFSAVRGKKKPASEPSIKPASLKHFDIVVANPPFSLEKWGHEGAEADTFSRFRRGVPPRTKGDYAFILHMIETMKPRSGRMAVVVPHGVLFRGAAEGRIRKQLIDENLLDVVIGLPEKLFYGTGIPAAILVFRKKKVDDKVLFIDASRDYRDGKNQNFLRDADLARIVDTVQARHSVDKYAYLASPAEIAGNDYNLNIPRYVDTFEEEAEIDLVAVRKERLELKAELAKLEEQMARYLKELGYE
ncbi:type I restriction-modification system subunit M [Rhodanobacter spathiphylli]|uniref:site-specific DNA-methyltransferase (adenine-specific) n=1 Tax=Rhodanobacter spathiphylli B39 TaxID=1163407 RepID=I4W7G1_9GAMM|nr:type I restriction-modification system subunit M [Rhodanobacter spathiphylli]EIL95402.1 type I restriction-modification system, M subunit [Rhodanobacter spathiphylli B39]TAM23951.1 MAG: type I restriction-modification system subunit M [Rhodanobacter sp.]